MPIFDYTPGTSPEASGTLMFYKQGSDPSSGFQVDTEGNIISGGPVNVFNVTAYGTVGDGVTDDIDAIQAAFDAAAEASAASGGAVVLFPPQTYAISTYITAQSDITVMAYGATIIASADSGLFRNFVPSDSFAAYEGNSRIAVYGGIWDSNAADSGSGTVTSIRDAFTFSHGSDIILRDLVVRNVSSAHAVDLAGVKNVIISGCRFEGFKDNDGARSFSEAIQLDYAISGSGGIGLNDDTPTVNVTVEACWFGPSDRLGPYGRALGSHTSTGASNWCEGIIFQNNIVEATGRENVRAYGWRHAVIEGNVFQGVGSASYANVAVTGPDPATAGYVNVCDDILISGNVVDGTGALNAIRVAGFATALPTNVRITGNICDQSVTSGIYVWFATAPSVEGNTVADSTTAGIYVLSCTDPDVVANKIVGVGGTALGLDTCTRGQATTNSIITAGGHGILVSGGSNVSVNNNRVYNVVTSGIRATSSTSRVRIINNVVITAAIGIEVTASAGNALVINNDLTGSGWAVGTALSLLGVPAPTTDFSGGTASPGWNLVS
jgi:parallel beta-helix repeat protein